MVANSSLTDSCLSHRNNIAQKCRVAPTDDIRALCREVQDRYTSYVNSLCHQEILAGNFAASITAVGEYLDFAKSIEKTHSFFNWRSDFASSILPEFLHRIFEIVLNGIGISPLFSTRDSIVEVSLSGTPEGGWDLRRKNQDLCIGLRKEKVLCNNVEVEFIVPLIAMEVKTNIDINKLNGLDYSAERLKRTFPAARYLLVTETIDFSLSSNYAAGSVDEVYALRKQVRSQSRRQKAPLQVDVFEALADDVISIMKKASVSAGHVYDRLPHGKLINVN